MKSKKTMNPHFAISYDEHYPSEIFNDLKESLFTENFVMDVEERESYGPFMCLEWFLPAAIMAYISKSYFDSFLSEMGKDHYRILKENISKLLNSLMPKPDTEPKLVASSEKKLSNNNPFSLVFAFYADTKDGRKFKLLIKKYSPSQNYQIDIDQFMQFLEMYYSGEIGLQDIGFDESAKIPSKDIFIHYNKDTNSIEWLDHRKYIKNS